MVRSFCPRHWQGNLERKSPLLYNLWFYVNTCFNIRWWIYRIFSTFPEKKNLVHNIFKKIYFTNKYYNNKVFFSRLIYYFINFCLFVKISLTTNLILFSILVPVLVLAYFIYKVICLLFSISLFEYKENTKCKGCRRKIII